MPPKPTKPDSLDNDSHEDEQLISKSAIKRELAERTALIGALIEESEHSLDLAQQQGLIDPQSRHHIDIARSIRKGNARKREIKYISKRLRDLELSTLREFLDQQHGASLKLKQREARITRHRDRLIAEPDQALASVLEAYPQANRQQLRQLARQAQHDQQNDKDRGNAKKLIRLLRELDQS